MTQITQSFSPLSFLWDLLASIRLTVVILLLLAVLSIVGTLIPQSGTPTDYIRQYGESVYRLLYAFDLADMYRSWWFRGLIALLAANIVVCTWKRFPSVWKSVMKNSLTLSARRLEDKGTINYTSSENPEKLQPGYKTYFKRCFRRYQTESIENGFRIIGEKGRWTRLSVTGVHLSIIMLLVGAMIGSLYGLDGYVNIAEGEQVDRIRLRNGDGFLPLGFEIFCEDFDVSFHETGAPREYRSRLRIIEGGQTVMEKDISVNDPLRYKGINLFQSSYGKLPPKTLNLSFISKKTGEKIERILAVGQKTELPDSGKLFYLKEIKRSFRLRDMDVGETIIGVMENPDGRTTEVILPMRFPTYDKMRQGEWMVSVESYENGYYTGLQVTRDPGVPLVYAGFVLLLAGCFSAFFRGHEKVAVDVIATNVGSRVWVYGRRSRDSIGFENNLKKHAADLSGIR